MNRRDFIQSAAQAGTAVWLCPPLHGADEASPPAMTAADLPRGPAPPPVPAPHFPDRLHAFVWRNWTLVPLERMAAAVGAEPEALRQIGRDLGLPAPPRIPRDQQRRSCLTVIRRNWHLLPYEQLLKLLGWTPEQLAYTLREDDFLWHKLGKLKPACAPLKYAPPGPAARQRAREIARLLREYFPAGPDSRRLFEFVSQLSAPPPEPAPAPRASRFRPRFCYSYFALYGDPLLDAEADPYPGGYLARLAAAGVESVWLPAVLYKLAPFPWQPELSARYKERQANLRRLVERARRHGMGLYLYLNEPRALPRSFFHSRPELRGVVEGDHAALCTSHPAVQNYLTDSVAAICRAAPGLAGFFTITASENLTNCWSHHRGSGCPRCGRRPPAEVLAEVNRLIAKGIRRGGEKRRAAAGGAPADAPALIVWDWGWRDDWAEAIIRALPRGVSLMSVSEWGLPIERGGVKSAIGEYCLSAIGPGPRARRHWRWARERGLRTLAKIQAGNTWELSAVPYIPALENVAQHAANLRAARVDGIMLGWTLGGYPSPNLEVVAEIGSDSALTPGEALRRVAERRFGPRLAPRMVTAWRAFSAAFREFPFAGGLVYRAPLQTGPANPLWGEPTGYAATMVGFPYDDLDGWRAIYPPEIFIGQLEKVAAGFERALAALRRPPLPPDLPPAHAAAWAGELRVAEAAAIHFRSVAQQARFVLARRALAAAKEASAARRQEAILERLLRAEIKLARRLHTLQSNDARLGFEASNQYFYIPADLAEKVLNCRDLLDRWLPEQRARGNA